MVKTINTLLSPPPPPPQFHETQSYFNLCPRYLPSYHSAIHILKKLLITTPLSRSLGIQISIFMLKRLLTFQHNLRIDMHAGRFKNKEGFYDIFKTQVNCIFIVVYINRNKISKYVLSPCSFFFRECLGVTKFLFTLPSPNMPLLIWIISCKLNH